MTPVRSPGPRPLLGVLVAAAPAEGDFPSLESALLGALQAGEDAAIFLMDDGTLYALDPRLRPFLDAGVEITLCAMDAEARGVDCDTAAATGITLGGQPDHARILRDCERFLSFT